MTEPMKPQRLAYSVEESLRLLGISRKKFYAEAKAGRLLLRKSGRRTLVLADDLHAYLAALPVLTFPGQQDAA